MYTKAKLTAVKRQKTQIKLTFTVNMSESDLNFESYEGFPGYLMFAGKPIVEEIQKAMNDRHFAVDYHNKTPSQIQRGLILELKDLEDPEGLTDYENFYLMKMNKVAEWLRSKIEKLRI